MASKNFRYYMVAQQLSSIGVWIQAIATTWLVLSLSRSSLAVGITATFEWGPFLVVGPYAGALADRWPRFRIMIWTNTLICLAVTTLGVLTATHRVTVPEIWFLALAMGILDAVDSPARQGLLFDLVGAGLVVNATALSDAAATIGRLIGPLIAGTLILWRGPGACYLINALSEVAIVIALISIRKALRRRHAPPEMKKSVRDGFDYLRRHVSALSMIVLMFLVGLFGFNSQVLFSALARSEHGNALQYALLNTIFGVGALTGSLIITRVSSPAAVWALAPAVLLGCSFVAISALHSKALVLCFVFCAGSGGGLFLSATAGRLQRITDEAVRGRIMALFSVGFLGTSAIGAPAMGFLIEHPNVYVAFLVAGLGCIAAAGVAGWIGRGQGRYAAR